MNAVTHRICAATAAVSAAVTVALFAAPLAAQQSPPAPAAPKDFRLPPRANFTLPNGLRVSMVHFGSIPKVFVRVTVLGAGAISERENQVWLSKLTAEEFKEGTPTRSADQVARDAASMGGSITAIAAPDRTNFFGDVLTERGPEFVRLLADVVQHPRFDASDIERNKSTLLRNLAIDRSQPQPIAQERYAAMMYPGHPYGRIFPTDSMLRGYGVDQVRGFYAANFGAGRAHIYVAGVFDDSAMARAIRSEFGGWARGSDTSYVATPPAATTRSVALIDRPGAVQSTVMLGLRVPGPRDSDYVPLVVTDALLGGSFGSRITKNIREDKGYTYSPYSYIDDSQHGASWQEAEDVTTSVTGASLTEIFKEIDRLSKEPPSQQELSGIQTYLSGVFLIQNADRQGIGNQLAYIDLYNLGDEWLRSYVHRIVSVTPEQVSRITATYLRPDRMQLVVVGDKKIVLDQLAPWGTVVP